MVMGRSLLRDRLYEALRAKPGGGGRTSPRPVCETCFLSAEVTWCGQFFLNHANSATIDACTWTDFKEFLPHGFRGQAFFLASRRPPRQMFVLCCRSRKLV